jgi:hypothetical protein
VNAARHIAAASAKIGYRSEAICYDYHFSDFIADRPVTRQTPLAVFTQSPPSYRSAAFGVLEVPNSATAATIVDAHRALGAPVFFAIDGSSITVWQVYGHGPARLLQRSKIGDLDSLFAAHQHDWSPEAIHRAKTIGRLEPAYQLDFVDLGLLPAIESQIHQKLDHLLAQTFVAIPHDKAWSTRALFQGVFRLLAAKILVDRRHPAAQAWRPDDVSSVLTGIGQYYGLQSPEQFVHTLQSQRLAPAWEVLHAGLNVANISADDLAYVYENTLVTPETRRAYGTHSTPRQVAEFIAGRLRLWDPAQSARHIYEPFTGAGVLLVAAVRHLREALPADWSDQQRHDHLVRHVRGSELDAFACEVATLSLILADYPNTNGWKIDNADLFEPGRLDAALQNADVILCNPPFEALTPQERQKYPALAAAGGTKGEAVFRQAILASPAALGFVLPQSVLLDRAYDWHRRQLERRYSEIELVSLPDGIFRESTVESALVIARDPVPIGNRQRVKSSEVLDADRRQFLSTGVPSRSRSESRIMGAEPSGELWLPRLSELWQQLLGLPTLGSLCEGHWGLRWKDGGQKSAGYPRPAIGRARGLLRARDHRQFALGETCYLDVRPSAVYGAGDLPWARPKILCNAGRSSRGTWRIAAAVDREGLVASQQFACLWPTSPDVDLDALAAVINSPLGNAYLHEHSTDRRLRIATLLALPLPAHLPPALGEISREYARLVADGALFQQRALQDLLDRIDDTVLEAYNLSPRIIRALLSEFRGERRPLAHDWSDWDVSSDSPALTVRELRSDWVRESRAPWPSRELPPVPEEEMKSLLRAVG